MITMLNFITFIILVLLIEVISRTKSYMILVLAIKEGGNMFSYPQFHFNGINL